jgi:ribonuclease M5
MRRVREVIVVEGRYDKNALRQTVDATVLETKGFGVFKDRERLALLRRLERGLILLTDSDGAGFVIRNFLKGAIPKSQLKQAYIPDVPGKERRKDAPGREGKLGVEGMPPAALLEALERAGATFEDGGSPAEREPVTKADFYELGLTGGPDSGAKRAALLKKLGLPERMTANALLEAVNILYARETFMEMAND